MATIITIIESSKKEHITNFIIYKLIFLIYKSY